ncbi:MAG TPA: hypothetical protein VI035_03380 [Solirubrobacterales bacterium]
MRGVVIPSLLVVAVLAIGGCGGGDDEGSDDSTTAQTGGDLFTQTTHRGTLSPIAGKDDVFELTFAEPSPDVTVFTDRPVRSASTEALADFVDGWDDRGFGQDPPNAALVLDEEPDDADTAVFTLADPSYDQASGAVTYTATHVNGGSSSLPSDEHIDPPPSFGDAHLFIDPSGGGDEHTIAVDVGAARQGAHTQITFDSPWTVFVGAGEQGGSWVVGPNAGGGFATTSVINLTSSGGAQFNLEGGTGAITGTAIVPSGANVGIQVDDNPEQTVKNGKFSLSP